MERALTASPGAHTLAAPPAAHAAPPAGPISVRVLPPMRLSTAALPTAAAHARARRTRPEGAR